MKHDHMTRNCYEMAVYSLLGIEPDRYIKTFENGRNIIYAVYHAEKMLSVRPFLVCEVDGEEKRFPLLYGELPSLESEHRKKKIQIF